MDITTTTLSHLGLVSGTFYELGIADIIDANIPKSRSHNIPHSIVMKAMCMNGLGFNESRLYLYSKYFEILPAERLLGKGILPEHINDDVLGRTLDKIYEHGCTELFNKIVLKAMKNVPLDKHILHNDTTSFSLYGNLLKERYHAGMPGLEKVSKDDVQWFQTYAFTLKKVELLKGR